MSTLFSLNSQEYIILVTGSRDWTDENMIAHALQSINIPENLTPVLVHGDCPTGADAMAHKIATQWKWKIRKYPAQWQKYGKSAGPRRNQEMISVEQPHVGLGFSKNHSSGTKNTCDLLMVYSTKPLNRLKYLAIYDDLPQTVFQMKVLVNK